MTRDPDDVHGFWISYTTSTGKRCRTWQRSAISFVQELLERETPRVLVKGENTSHSFRLCGSTYSRVMQTRRGKLRFEQHPEGAITGYGLRWTLLEPGSAS